MNKAVTVKPQKISKKIQVIASKSMLQRIIACAVLSERNTVINNISMCDDCKAALSVAESLGAEIIVRNNRITIIPGKKEVKNIINCGESGLAVRMFSPIVTLFGDDFEITGSGSLKKRPLNEICDALKQSGVKCRTNKGFIPVSVSGKLKGGKIEIDASLSSQVLTGLLISLPKPDNDSVIKVKNLNSKPYIDLTLSILNDFGVVVKNKNYKEFYIKGNQKFSVSEYTVEGDWSGAAFLLTAGLIAGKIELTGLNLNSYQADKKIIDVIKKAGGKIYFTKNSVITEQSNLNSFKFDATHSPDLFPPLAVLAANCRGTSEIKGVKRLIYKESNRAETLRREFSKIGIEIKIKDDTMFIKGGKIRGGIINSGNDHRIAMAAAVIALNAESEIIIEDAYSINKSYPSFYEDLLGIK